MQLILHYDETYREVKYGNMGLPDIDSKMLMGINVTPIAALLYTPVLIRCQASVSAPSHPRLCAPSHPRLCGVQRLLDHKATCCPPILDGGELQRPCLFGRVRRERGNPSYRGGTKRFPPPHSPLHLHIWFGGGSAILPDKL